MWTSRLEFFLRSEMHWGVNGMRAAPTVEGGTCLQACAGQVFQPAGSMIPHLYLGDTRYRVPAASFKDQF